MGVCGKGGLEQARFAWGDELTPGEHRCNIWQGVFPTRNSAEDGYVGTAPARSFKPNGFGLYNVSGNVWEMCAGRWTTEHSAVELIDPQGPPSGADRVMRGGCYLCRGTDRNNPGAVGRAGIGCWDDECREPIHHRNLQPGGR